MSDMCSGAGQEVTQYTYFQQAAGLPLPVPSVEITYGLERIMTALQVNTWYHLQLCSYHVVTPLLTGSCCDGVKATSVF